MYEYTMYCSMPMGNMDLIDVSFMWYSTHFGTYYIHTLARCITYD